MRISDWSSDVCSSDLIVWIHWMMLIICAIIFVGVFGVMFYSIIMHRKSRGAVAAKFHEHVGIEVAWTVIPFLIVIGMALPATRTVVAMKDTRSEEHTSELQSLMRISYAVFCLKKKKQPTINTYSQQ